MRIQKLRGADEAGPAASPLRIAKVDEKVRRTSGRRTRGPAADSSTVLGRIVSEAIAVQLLTVRGAARRVGMSPAQLSRVMRGLYGVRSVHLARLIIGLNLSADQVVGAIYAESRDARDLSCSVNPL